MERASRSFIVLTASIVLSFTVGYVLRANVHRIKPLPVDATWISAARSCWLGLAQQHDDKIAGLLSDTNSFRATFPKYAVLGDDAIRETVRKKIGITFMNQPDCKNGIDLSGGYVIDNPTNVKTMYLSGSDDPYVCTAEDPYAKYGGHAQHQWFCDVKPDEPAKTN